MILYISLSDGKESHVTMFMKQILFNITFSLICPFVESVQTFSENNLLAVVSAWSVEVMNVNDVISSSRLFYTVYVNILISLIIQFL